MVHYADDYKFGKKEEADILPILKEFFKRDIQQTQEQYALYDYYDNEYQYEVKSRKNRYNTFSTTMITENKLRNDSKQIILFNFVDGIYYIEYDPEKFSKYERKMFSRAGLRWDEKSHVFIPISDLTLILAK